MKLTSGCNFVVNFCKNMVTKRKKHTSAVSMRITSVQSLSRFQLFATPWTAACQACLSITNSQSPPKLMSIESVMSSNHLILCCPLLLPPSIFPSIFSLNSILSDLLLLISLHHYEKIVSILKTDGIGKRERKHTKSNCGSSQERFREASNSSQYI